MAHLQRSRFLGIHAKLEKRKYDQFQMATKINNNTY